MSFFHPIAGRSIAAAMLAVMALLSGGTAMAASPFPFEQVLVLDAARIGAVKRVPVITIEADGRAVIDLWCKTVPARLEVDGPAVRIETAPLPEALPQYMSSGQCSDVRMQADADLIAALAQVTSWQRRGDRVSFSGPEGASPLRFLLSSH